MKKMLSNSCEILSHNSELKKIKKNNYVCCIGFFDLLHSGHQKIINKTFEIAKRENLKTICFTFDIKPRDFIINKINNIWSLKTRVKNLEQFKFDYIIKLIVNEDFLKTEPLDFLNTLKNQFNIKHIVIGDNFRFGSKASGDINTLIDFFSQENVSIVNVDSVSTTNIKQLINNGDISAINKLLNKKLLLNALLKEDKYNLELNSNQIKDGLYNVEILGKKFTINIVNNSFNLNLVKNIQEIEVFFC